MMVLKHLIDRCDTRVLLIEGFDLSEAFGVLYH